MYGKTQGTQRGGAGVFPGSGEAWWSKKQQGAYEEADARATFCYREEGSGGAVGEEGLAGYRIQANRQSRPLVI